MGLTNKLINTSNLRMKMSLRELQELGFNTVIRSRNDRVVAVHALTKDKEGITYIYKYGPENGKFGENPDTIFKLHAQTIDDMKHGSKNSESKFYYSGNVDF